MSQLVSTSHAWCERPTLPLSSTSIVPFCANTICSLNVRLCQFPPALVVDWLDPTVGAVVSIVIDNGADAALLLPAASSWTTVNVCTPSVSGVPAPSVTVQLRLLP